MIRPPDSVLRAFGVDGEVEPLAGGYETSIRVADVVLKRVLDLDVAHFGQQAMSRLELDSISVPTPRRTTAGDWSAEGWIATSYVEGLQSARNDPGLLMATGQELALALAANGPFDEGPVRARTDRWAVAERFAFGEIGLALDPDTRHVANCLRAQASEETAQVQLIHADLAGNVFIDPAGMPVVLDFTPAFRSTRFQSGVIVADTLLWGDQNSGHVALLDGDTASLARALMFRLIAAELGPGPGNVDLLGCKRVIVDLGWS